jgi:antitoxin component of RelBE/YafQ-DinJ toxin-antitoxin module
MALLVKPHNEEEEKVLLAFLNSLHYEYMPVEIDIPSPNDEKKQTLEEYNNEIAEAEAEYKKGNSVSTDELKKNMQGW